MKINEKCSTWWPNIEPGSLCRFNEENHENWTILKKINYEFDVYYGLKLFEKNGRICYRLKDYDVRYLKSYPIIFMKVVDAFYYDNDINDETIDTIFMCLDGKLYFNLYHKYEDYRNHIIPIG